MSKKRVVITGQGVISPIGIGKDEFWQSACQGKSSFSQIDLFDAADLKVNLAGQIKDFDAKKILGNINIRDLDRASIFLSSAVKLAINDSRLVIDENNTNDIGVSIGTTFGSLFSISEFDKEAIKDGPRYANPSVFTSTVGNSPASRASIHFKIKGFSSTISTGMCAGLDALEYGRNFILLDKAKQVIAGAVEALSQQIFLGFYKLNYLAGLSPGSEAISCPFDRRRNGIMLSEGAAAFVLEDFEEAKIRKAQIVGEILGVGSSFDPGKFYKYNPNGSGMAEAMKLALKDAGLKAGDIGCIFANANSTKDADLIETNAIKEVFGSYAKEVPVVAVKSFLGETYSASGALALSAAIGVLNNGILPATINLQKDDSNCDLDYVIDGPRSVKTEKIMINTFSPGGANTVLIIGK